MSVLMSDSCSVFSCAFGTSQCSTQQAGVSSQEHITTTNPLEDFAETASAAQVELMQTTWMPSAKVLGRSRA